VCVCVGGGGNHLIKKQTNIKQSKRWYSISLLVLNGKRSSKKLNKNLSAAIIDKYSLAYT